MDDNEIEAGLIRLGVGEPVGPAAFLAILQTARRYGFSGLSPSERAALAGNPLTAEYAKRSALELARASSDVSEIVRLAQEIS